MLTNTAYLACQNMPASVLQGVLSLVVAGLTQISSQQGAGRLAELNLAPAAVDARVAALAAFTAVPQNIEGISCTGGV